ncbi:MAG: thiamine-phosphate kinase [Rhodopseudomonas sp.]|nr:thiamine-phosphate kinase [Rhodopseudomonas sp.]
MSSDDTTSAEDKLIARYFGPVASHPGALGLSDDAALIKPPAGCELVLTVDALVGGVHFFNDDPAEMIAAKALRVNLSDLAAKGATPLGFLLSLALPKDQSDAWLEAFAKGLREDAAHYKCPLLGGDTVTTPGPVTISVTMFGSVPDGMMARRSGAQAGDKVFVTGTIGDGALGLKVRQAGGAPAPWSLTEEEHEFLRLRYLLPQPRNALAEAVRHYASAAMDVSDGLAGDLAKLARVSGVAAMIDATRVPLSEPARAAMAADPSAFETALTGGDDYEILCTVPPAKVDRFRVAAMAARVAVTEIGIVEAGAGTRFRDGDGRDLTFGRMAFSHF